ncbi:MAG: HlyD family efflux transporter periplasmic adaptor subunit, partial [Chloroflexi bacterium]|nr:HlyD family efflux transporter periplasmic adaptor subunit [Chloroflexota bacterium]
MALLRPLAFTWVGRGIVGLVAIALVGAVVIRPLFASSAPAVTERTATVTRGNVLQTVPVSGSLSASAVWKIPFGVSGRIVEIPVKVGQSVKTGDVLARIDPRDLKTAVKQAEVNLASAQARYDSVVAGVSADDVALARASVESAQRSYENAQQNGRTSIADARADLDALRAGYTAAQQGFQLLSDAIRTDVADLTSALDSLRLVIAATLTGFKGAETADVTSAKTALGTADGQLVNARTYATTTAAAALAEWTSARDRLIAAWLGFDGALARGGDTTDPAARFSAAKVAYDLATARLGTALAPITSALSSAQGSVTSAQNAMGTAAAQMNHDLDGVRAYLVGLQTAIVTRSSLASGIGTKLTQATGYEATISSAIGGSYGSALQALRSATDQAAQSIAGGEAALRSAELSYRKATTGPTPADVASAYASVQLAQLSLEKAQTDLDNATLKAPVDGVVATIANGVGESPASPFMTIAVTSTLILHGTVGESDITKLESGQVATVSVDAAGSGTRLTGKVTSLDPLATISQGVPVYGVDVQIDLPDPVVRPGMTGTASVIVASAQGVLTLPNLAIRTVSGQRQVQVKRNGQVVDAQVTFGIANDTMTEIRAGLSEGDVVVIPAARAATATQRPGG